MDQETKYLAWSTGIKNSDKNAFNECFRQLFPELTYFAYRYLKDKDGCTDIVQDVFVKLWNIRTELDTSKSLRSLLYTMVRNQCLNHLRDVKHRIELVDQNELDAFQQQDEDDHTIAEDGQKLHVMIADLPERQKECIEMSRFNGLSHQEIAEILELSARTVNNHIVAGLKTLKTKFQQYKESSMVL
jgi:RNA polymerase sigma-70 factor (ECF subfamily)